MPVIKVQTVSLLDRGGGIVSIPLVTHQSASDPKIISGISTYPPGEGAPFHSHNCDEQVTLLEGTGEVETEGVVTALEPYDSTYILADIVHAFRNTGNTPMKILWIYASDRVTRTFADSGETVEHLSAQDLMSDS